MTKHSLKIRWRAFRIWQKLGFMPWEKPRKAVEKRKGDFYKGAIPFLNDDAKRTFTHLLLRPGYMIRDYIGGAHDKYLAPLTALIIFYAFFALVSAVLAPVQHREESLFDSASEEAELEMSVNGDSRAGETLLHNTLQILKTGYTYLNLDKHPEVVDTRGESALAALEGTLRSQGIPLFIGQFFMLWLAMSVGLRRFKLGMGATAAASAYVLCQFSFFMLFAVLLTFGESGSVNALLMLALLTVDYCQWLGVPWKQGLRLGIRTGILYGVFLMLVFLLASAVVVAVAWLKGV